MNTEHVLMALEQYQDAGYRNRAFRRVLWTASDRSSQVVAMRLRGGEVLDLETHTGQQAFHVLHGALQVRSLGYPGEQFYSLSRIVDGEGAIVDPHEQHEVLAMRDTLLLTLYEPAVHPDGAVYTTKKDAEAARRENPAGCVLPKVANPRGAMKMDYISNDHYRVSDANAGALAKSVDAKLPRYGYELSIILPDGRPAILLRTPYGANFHKDAPARGWVWAVMPTNPASHFMPTMPR